MWQPVHQVLFAINMFIYFYHIFITMQSIFIFIYIWIYSKAIILELEQGTVM